MELDMNKIVKRVLNSDYHSDYQNNNINDTSKTITYSFSISLNLIIWCLILTFWIGGIIYYANWNTPNAYIIFKSEIITGIVALILGTFANLKVYWMNWLLAIPSLMLLANPEKYTNETIAVAIIICAVAAFIFNVIELCATKSSVTIVKKVFKKE